MMDEPVTFEVVRGRVTLGRHRIIYMQNIYAYGPVAGVSLIQQDFAPGDVLNVRVVTAGKWWKRHLVELALGSRERTCCITCRSESDAVRLALAIRDVLDQQREPPAQ